MKFGRKNPSAADALVPVETDPDDSPADVFEAAWPFNADSAQVEGVLREDRFLSVMLVDVTGLDWEAITRHLETVREIAKTKEMVPVFVVDLVEFRGLIAENMAYDTLPIVLANEELEQDLDWSGYLARRRQLLREKWRPAAIINLGLSADWDAT
ncbi:hypothetical protein [Ruegeria sp. HKCCD8929]|uniref:hypothetical protein n=1 Tax=Ruegeria sp. HKCCD8929 TaxID=2683006 RepID=UPI0020C1FAF6|nr:hypothetical protein [Ruegeria sp. HKCCD8929]